MATAKRPRAKKKTETKETPAAAKAPANKKVATVTTHTIELEEAIRLRAYELFAQRGCQHGADFDDWIRAEREIHERFSIAAA